MMNNVDVDDLLSSCKDELNRINNLLIGLGGGAVPDYMQRYAVIRATGSIETGFKKIIADKVDEGSHEQVKKFIDNKIRKSSCNPSLGQMESMLSQFDSVWVAKFKELLALENQGKLKGSLSHLVSNRNQFAHGGAPSLEIDKTIEYFNDAVEVLEILDSVVHMEAD